MATKPPRAPTNLHRAIDNKFGRRFVFSSFFFFFLFFFFFDRRAGEREARKSPVNERWGAKHHGIRHAQRGPLHTRTREENSDLRFRLERVDRTDRLPTFRYRVFLERNARNGVPFSDRDFVDE